MPLVFIDAHEARDIDGVVGIERAGAVVIE